SRRQELPQSGLCLVGPTCLHHPPSEEKSCPSVIYRSTSHSIEIAFAYVLVANASRDQRLHRATQREHLRRNWEIKVYRLRTRGQRSAFASKISSPNTSTWLEFVSQAAIFMGPVGAILLGNGYRWGFVLGLATQPFWFYTSFRYRQWGVFIASIFY